MNRNRLNHSNELATVFFLGKWKKLTCLKHWNGFFLLFKWKGFKCILCNGGKGLKCMLCYLLMVSVWKGFIVDLNLHISPVILLTSRRSFWFFFNVDAVDAVLITVAILVVPHILSHQLNCNTNFRWILSLYLFLFNKCTTACIHIQIHFKRKTPRH